MAMAGKGEDDAHLVINDYFPKLLCYVAKRKNI
jgi:hypothetical protein